MKHSQSMDDHTQAVEKYNKSVRQYKINEIFYSIQGEGSYVGVPMVFIRFSGCNLSCPWCDTKHQTHSKMTVEEIVRIVNELSKTSPICLTGGEPTIQLDVPLIKALSPRPLHLETNGVLELDSWGISLLTCITISPKLMPLGMELIQPYTDLKLVMDDSDKKKLAGLIDAWGRLKFRHKFIQPCTYPDGRTTVMQAIAFVKAHPEWKLGLQIHKLIGLR